MPQSLTADSLLLVNREKFFHFSLRFCFIEIIFLSTLWIRTCIVCSTFPALSLLPLLKYIYFAERGYEKRKVYIEYTK